MTVEVQCNNLKKIQSITAGTSAISSSAILAIPSTCRDACDVYQTVLSDQEVTVSGDTFNVVVAAEYNAADYCNTGSQFKAIFYLQ